MTSPLSVEAIASVVRAGLRAPSGDNCQPWRFRLAEDRLRIVFVPERADSFYDVHRVASWISLGALLANLEIAARSQGIQPDVELFPTGEPPEVVATLRLKRGEPTQEPLARAIEGRCVNRWPYRPDPVPARFRDEVMTIASAAPGVNLLWVDEPTQRKRLAALAAQNDRLLFEHRALHDGLYRWIRWTAQAAAESHDGMPVGTLGLLPFERPGIRLLGSWRLASLLAAMGGTRFLQARAQRLYRRSAALVMLTLDECAPEDFVRAGDVFERIWLTADLYGVAFQPITGIVFLLLRLWQANGEGLSSRHRRLLERTVSDLRDLLPGIGDRTPVMLFRLGLPLRSTSVEAPRLPLSDVFDIAPAGQRPETSLWPSK